MYKAIEYAGVVRASTARRLTPILSLLLGWAVLDERISVTAGAGMALIGISFLLLYWENRAKILISSDDPQAYLRVSYGLAFGVASAALYAVSYMARKFGLVLTPDAYLGALVGALTAVAFFVVASMASKHYRTISVATIHSPDPWQVLAAVLISFGQILQFAALTYIGIGRVAFINSAEVFISAILAVFVFRTEPIPHRAVIAAMILATAGVLLIISQN